VRADGDDYVLDGDFTLKGVTQPQELSTVWQGADHIASAAAAIAFVVPEPPSERRKVTDQYDVGQATMAMMLAATDLGIGTGHSSVGDQDKARAIWESPTITRWPTCSVSGIPPIARWPRFANRTVARSTRSCITDTGEHTPPYESARATTELSDRSGGVSGEELPDDLGGV
jgi:hypothetical protein